MNITKKHILITSQRNVNVEGDYHFSLWLKPHSDIDRAAVDIYYHQDILTMDEWNEFVPDFFREEWENHYTPIKLTFKQTVSKIKKLGYSYLDLDKK